MVIRMGRDASAHSTTWHAGHLRRVQGLLKEEAKLRVEEWRQKQQTW